jgi:hypothetical protein
VTTLRFPLGSEMTARWICAGPIDGLTAAYVRFQRAPERDELIALDDFEMQAGPGDYGDGAYKITGVADTSLRPGTYRPVAARVRLRQHAKDVVVDLGRYADEFAIVLFDDSILATRG